MKTKINFSRLDDLAGMAPEFTYEDEPGAAPAEPAKDNFSLVPERSIRQANELKEKILNGLSTGEPEYIPLMYAVEAIGLLTNDEQFSKTVKDTILAVHGEGLEREIPLEWLLESLEANRAKLEKTLNRTNLKPETRARIEAALTDTNSRINYVQESLYGSIEDLL